MVEITVGDTTVSGDTLKEATKKAKQVERKLNREAKKREEKRRYAQLIGHASITNIAYMVGNMKDRRIGWSLLTPNGEPYYQTEYNRIVRPQPNNRDIFVTIHGEKDFGTVELMGYDVDAIIQDGAGTAIAILIVDMDNASRKEWYALGVHDGEAVMVTIPPYIEREINGMMQTIMENK